MDKYRKDNFSLVNVGRWTKVKIIYEKYFPICPKFVQISIHYLIFWYNLSTGSSFIDLQQQQNAWRVEGLDMLTKYIFLHKCLSYWWHPRDFKNVSLKEIIIIYQHA